MALFCCSCLTPKYETRTSDKAHHTNQDGNMLYHKHTMEATRSRSLCVCSYPAGRAVNVKLAARLLPPSPSGGGVCLPGEVICFTKHNHENIQAKTKPFLILLALQGAKSAQLTRITPELYLHRSTLHVAACTRSRPDHAGVWAWRVRQVLRQPQDLFCYRAATKAMRLVTLTRQ